VKALRIKILLLRDIMYFQVLDLQFNLTYLHMAIADLKLSRQSAPNVQSLSLSNFAPTNSVAASSTLPNVLPSNPGESSPTSPAAQCSSLIDSLPTKSVAAMSFLPVRSLHAFPTAEPSHLEFRQDIFAAASSVAPASAPASPQTTAQLEYCPASE
jgi:hypothetical protein